MSLYKKFCFGKIFSIYSGTIMVDIDPLTLVEQTPLRCFGEEHQERLPRFLKTFLNICR
jgi:hypothetical protein